MGAEHWMVNRQDLVASSSRVQRDSINDLDYRLLSAARREVACAVVRLTARIQVPPAAGRQREDAAERQAIVAGHFP
jgi:hypothetical protein